MNEKFACDCEKCDAERMTRAPENMPPPKKVTISDLVSARVEEALEEAAKEVDSYYDIYKANAARRFGAVTSDIDRLYRKALRKKGVLK